MPARKGLLAPQNNFLDTIATRFDGTHSNFVLGNAQVPSLYPIVYCSDGFCELTGHQRAQIMQRGCACNFLYGEDTKEEDKKAIEQALQDRTELKLEVIFYRKNGTPFWCLLDIVPIKNEKHEVVLYLASHKDITKSKMTQPQTEDASGSKSGAGSSNSSEEPDEEEDEEPDAKKAVYHRRRSRAVLYQLGGHYRKSVSMKRKLKYRNNILRSSSLPEYKAQNIKKPLLIISHYGLFKTVWDWLILLGTCYVACIVPFSVTFQDTDFQEVFIYSDVVIEIVFIMDIFINFKTTFVNKKGEVVTDAKSIIKNYLSTWFLLDFFAALPLDLLYALDLYERSSLLNMVKLIRLSRTVRLYFKIDRYSHNSYMILLLLILGFATLAHWFACVWYFIASKELFYYPDKQYGWLKQLSIRLGYDVLNASETGTTYITALYFTTSSLTSVGFGNVSANTNSEKAFSVIIMIFGALMHAVVFGNITAIIQRIYARKSQYSTRLRDLKDFYRLHQLPKTLRTRMNEFFTTQWSLNHGIDAHDILEEFPEELRGDVCLHLHKEMLSLPIFATAPQGCVKLLSQHIRSIFSAPEEYLVHNGDALNYIYLVCNGSMEVLQNGMVVAILGKGDLVGCNIPYSLDSESLIKSSGDVKAITYCDLKSIQISGLLEVLRLYPEFAEIFCREIMRDLTFNLREGFDMDDVYDNNMFDYGHMAGRDEDDEEIDEESNDDRHDDSPHDDTNDGGKGAGSEQTNKDVYEMDEEDILSDSNQTTKANKTKSVDRDEALKLNRKISQSQDTVNSIETLEQTRNRLSKRCSLDKVGSMTSLNENCLQNRIVNSADRLEQLAIEPNLKYGQLRLVDDDTNEDEEDPDSIASCPPTTQQSGGNKSLLITKLKANAKSSNKRNPLTENGESSPPDMQNKRKYLHFNTNLQDLPPAFRSRKTVGYNLLAGANQDRATDRNRAGQYRTAQMQPRKALRFSQQLNSSGSSASNHSPIFNSFAERRRAQFTNFNSMSYSKTGNVQPGGRRNSGASIHSMLYDQDSATAAAVQAVHETTTDSLERMDNQLHGLGDEVHKLSTDVKMSLYLLKQMCDLTAANLTQNQVKQSSKEQANQSDNQSQAIEHTCNCNSKIIEQLKCISTNIETSAQLTSLPITAKQAGGILKNKKRPTSSNSSLSLTDMMNEHRVLMNKQVNQQREKSTVKLEKCSSHSTLSLPIHNSSPPSSTKSDLKSKILALQFDVSIPIKETGETKTVDQESKITTIKQSSLEEEAIDSERQTPTLRNVRHSWNSLSQFIDSSSSNEQAVDSKDSDLVLKSDSQTGATQVEVDMINAHSETPILANIAIASRTLINHPQSNGTPPNLSCMIDMQPDEKKS